MRRLINFNQEQTNDILMLCR